MRRRTSCIWTSGQQNAPAGGNKKSFPKVPGTFGKLFEKGGKMDIYNLTEVIANQGFPIALSILLIFRIDKFMQEIVIAQKKVIVRYWKTPKRYIIPSPA